MAEQRVTRGAAGEGIVELRGGVLEIDSFTEAGVRWKTHPNGWCNCPRYENTGYCKKHPTTAEAVQKIRGRRRRCPMFGKNQAGIAENRIIELCKEIFRPVKYDSKGYPDQHPIDSYELYLNTVGCRHSTERMVKEAARRHGRILIAYGRQDGRAA